MAKWLDKYEQGGLVLKKKTKDNFSLKGNANDSKVSVGPNFVGEGTFNGPMFKNPAWKGQFAVGGSLPGSVGFMYARTQNPAPANGKYTKKTLASAQNGTSKRKDLTEEEYYNPEKPTYKSGNKAMDMLSSNPWLMKLPIIGDKIKDEAYKQASKSNYPIRTNEEIEGKAKVAGEQQYLDTKGYQGVWNEDANDPNNVDLLKQYIYGNQNLTPSLYAPKDDYYKFLPSYSLKKRLSTNATTDKAKHLSPIQLKDLEDVVKTHNPKFYHRFDTSDDPALSNVSTQVFYDKTPDLGHYRSGLGYDEDVNLPYAFITDAWDFYPKEYEKDQHQDKENPTNNPEYQQAYLMHKVGKPYKIYDRTYIDPKTKGAVSDKEVFLKKTMNRASIPGVSKKEQKRRNEIWWNLKGKSYNPNMQNGGEMEYYQNGLDFKPKSISKKGKKIVKDDRGQWAHPGEITEIGSNDITMQGVDYPVLGISDTGDTQMMYPDQDYKFDGEKVTEYPMAQNGKKWLNKYATEPMRQDATRNKQFEESVKNTIDQYRRAIDPENQPHISKWTPKPGEIKRLEEQDRQRREENSGFLNRLAANPHVAKLQNNVLIPMFDLYTVGEGAVAAKAIAKPALKQAGKYLTEKTALKNAYKLNPKAFKPTEGMMYRGLGKEGMEDAFESGVFRAKQNIEPIMHGPFDFSKQFNKAYFSPKFDVADRYGKGYIAEVPRAASDWGKRYGKKEWSQIAQKDIPITEGKILQKDWWKGYKEVPRNKMSAPEITRGPVNWWESPTFKKNNPNYDPTKPPLNPFPKYTAENVPEELKPYLTWDTEIDWGKWNPEIPKNEKLMQEYINIENTAKNEGTWMKNPDGSKFAGTPEQFVQSRSENFKKAFPQGADVVYRGDHSHYEALRGKGEEFYGKPIFTTPDKELAELYAYKEPMTSPYYNPNIETVEQKLQRMYGPDMTVEKFRNEYPEIAGRILETNDGGLYELAIPKTTNELTFNAGKNFHHYLSNPEVYDKLIKEGIVPHKRPEPGIFDTDNVAELIEKTGLDRATIKNVNDGKIADVLIHNQRPGNYAKSLRGNSGMFDMNNPNIYKALIPAVGTAGLIGASQKKHGGWLNKYK